MGYGADEWRGLPWWQTRLYEEGLVEEFANRDEDAAAEVVPIESLGVVWA